MNYDLPPEHLRDRYTARQLDGCCGWLVMINFPDNNATYDYAQYPYQVVPVEERAWRKLSLLSYEYDRLKRPILFTLTDKQSVMKELVDACPDVRLLSVDKSRHGNYNIYMYAFDKNPTAIFKEEE